ncbi:hypothetical protein BGX23_000071 [Mortierella sp. AD031]|nr:hypothetical protein BGX23_000071 [Mortierella sp. AD031]
MGRRRGRGTAAVGSEGIVFERMTQIDSGDDQNQHHHADHDNEDEDTMYISPKEMAARNRKKWIPAMVAALLASPAYALVPGQARRLTMALYFLTYAGESAYAALEHEGLLKWVPSWVGVWILAPISTSQIVHTFIHHTDCTPLAWKKLIMSQCDPFLHRPKSFDTKTLGPFPLAEQLFEGMGNYLQAGYRAQPILASAASVATASAAALASDGSSGARRFLLPEACESVIKFTEGMGHHSAGCAIFHPQDPSCRGAMKTLVRRNAVFSFKMYAVLAALTFVARGGNVFNKGVLNYFTKTTLSILRSTVATWGIVVTAFPMYCGMDRLAFLPDSFLTTKRHYLNGFLGGLWVLLETPARQSALTLYFTRFMIESIWRRAVKAGWAKSFRGGETMLFGVAMALVMGVFETTPGLARRTVIQSALSKVFTD